MKRPDRPRVTGALAPYAEGFRKELSRKGYSPWTAPEHMYLMSDLSRWLDGRDLSPAQVSSARIEEFLIHRRSCTQARWITPRAIAPLLGYLRGLGVVRRRQQLFRPVLPRDCWSSLPPTWPPSEASVLGR